MRNFTTRPEILGDFGVVASTHWIASGVGMSVLERGGNAFDAAVATGFTLQIVEPHLNGPGGEVPMLIAKHGEAPRVVCGQGVAPANATLDAYRSLDLNIVPGSGLLSAVVPGAFDAWMMMLLDYGTLHVRDVLSYAISYAQNGVPVLPNIAGTIGNVKQLFDEHWNTSAQVYLPNGAVPKVGGRFANPAIAATYLRIIEEAESIGGSRDRQIENARKIWREGFVAEAIDSFFRENEFMDTSGQRNGGLLTGQDMANWHASYEEPLSYSYKGYEVLKTGPWGQGPTFLQQLALLKGFDLDGLSPTDPNFVHLVAEATKLAFADRERFYGDPNFVDVPMATLLSDDYNDQRRKLIGETASFDQRPGRVEGFGGPLVDRPKGETPEGRQNKDMGEPTVARFDELPTGSDGRTKGDTCHLDIIDRWGNMVTATPSGGWLQSSPVVPELGFCLTNRAQMFWLDERSASCIAPGKRPRTTLSVSMAMKDGSSEMIFGTPGGDQQDQWSLHHFLRYVHFGQNLQEAIDAPGFHTNHVTSSFYPREADAGHLVVEGRFGQSTVEELKRKGHKLQVDGDWTLGRMTAASKTGGYLRAGANARFMQGYALGR
ncbi:gamma-glutamyltransferase family protein [Maritalea porphyrae]|uniref:gamma-glutamyltransferase family protein n=1 Tax=Maritalea porphyrae TaxID=880732 RepID=UPI0022B03281|nr:gamma-glutamyltransferase family protein [Maritalea porphyrae]MCZ4272540.1 gamma-glutamyltransferase family protein [Maritalea porphyrae]